MWSNTKVIKELNELIKSTFKSNLQINDFKQLSAVLDKINTNLALDKRENRKVFNLGVLERIIINSK